MELKIIGGKYRGLKLTLPDYQADFRPTKNQLREALMSILVSDIAEAKVLELCAGSGIVSLELVSRGALLAQAIEQDSQRVQAVNSLLAGKEIASSFTLIAQSVEDYLASSTDTFDIIFFDPPYYTNNLTDTLPAVYSLLNEYGVAVFEFASDDSYAMMKVMTLGTDVAIKKYGNSSIALIRR